MPETITRPITPVRTNPEVKPWREVLSDPGWICDQQQREAASPDLEP